MDGWNLALLVVAAYVAVVALVRLMLARRDQMLDQFRQEVAKEKGRRRREGEKPAQDRAA
jgi:hypothetical protein